jgi:signal transduction histidine kinase
MDPAQRARFLAHLVEDARRMERLVTRMLEFARIENAASELGEGALVQDLRAFVESALMRYGTAVQLESTAALPACAIPDRRGCGSGDRS